MYQPQSLRGIRALVPVIVSGLVLTAEAAGQCYLAVSTIAVWYQVPQLPDCVLVWCHRRVIEWL